MSSRESTTTRRGCCATATARTSRRGSSSRTVPMPVRMAAARARQRCPSSRAADEVIHWLRPLCKAVVPSKEAATFIRTQGRPRSIRDMKPMFRARARAIQGPWSTCTSMPACRSSSTPRPRTKGLGSRHATSTRATPACTKARLHGGVRPWWLHGSKLTHTVAPRRSKPCSWACCRAWASA